jgi:8-oxo-dGTP diphosphatase
MPYTYESPRPALAVDIAVFALGTENLQAMLIERDLAPLGVQWSLPGGFMRIDETLEEAAHRELAEETGLTDIFLEQLYTFGAVNRDPRERIVTVAYFALVNVHTSSEASNAEWFPINDLPQLAFDHETILMTALARLRGKVRYQPIGFKLLPEKFTLRQLQQLYEVIFDRELDKRNFRKKVHNMGIVVPLREIEKVAAHRAARLYRFDKKKYDRLTKKGFDFEI